MAFVDTFVCVHEEGIVDTSEQTLPVKLSGAKKRRRTIRERREIAEETAGSYTSSTEWGPKNALQESPHVSSAEVTRALQNGDFLLLTQHSLIDMAEVPGVPVSSISILHGDGIALLEGGKLVRSQGECHLVG